MAYVEFRDVGKTYRMGEVEINALHDATFEIEKGELVVIVGPSGAGKTTLLNILGGMDTLSEGQVFLDGREVSKMTRKQLYSMATGLVVVGYAVFFISGKSLALVVLGAMLVFVGQAFIQTLMLMFLADTVEYGQWKLGKRNESITFSVQPLVNKIGGALATGIVSISLIISGIKVDESTADFISAQGQMIVRMGMFALPLAMIVIGYIIYLKKFKISEEFYAEILKDLEK